MKVKKQTFVLGLFLLSLVAIISVLLVSMHGKKEDEIGQNTEASKQDNKENKEDQPVDAGVATLENTRIRSALINKAKKMAAGYDYDGAVHLLKSNSGYEKYQDITGVIQEFASAKAKLVKADVTKIPHVFFHPLIYDTDAAFKNNTDASSVKSLHTAMTTVNEFNEILKQLYKNDYVLVRLHDAAEVVPGKNGKKRLKAGNIMLPRGKKPIIISEDDVNYYEKWKYKGVASRLVMDQNGKPTCEVDLPNGKTIKGDYDVAPLLERFIEKHPDFSYKGARAALVVTGREGVFGYRTSKYVPREDTNPTINSQKNFNINSEEAIKAKAVSEGLRKAGFELGSHSFVHEGLGYCSMNFIKYDTNRWKNECESILGKSDIIIYPKGEDIEHGENGYKYVGSNQRFKILSNAGFLFFCNVDGSNPTWTIMGKNYFRQARIALDGNVMYYQKSKLKSFYGLNVNRIWDKGRPKQAPSTTY